MRSRNAKIGLAIGLALVLIGGIVVAVRAVDQITRHNVVAYFENSNGLFVGDDVVVLGMPIGKIEKIEPQPDRVKVSFWYDDQYKVPADADAVILAPSLVTVRVIQLTPAYTSGPVLGENAEIPKNRTAVPVEYDDLRQQLEKLTEALQPSQPGGVSSLGAFVNTAADNLRGNGADIRQTIINLSGAISALGDHSGDLFGTMKSLATLVSALKGSSGLLEQLNQNLASVTSELSNDPNEVANAVKDLNDVVDDARTFVADNREAMGTTVDKLASVSQAVADSLPDIKQTLHVAAPAFQNLANIYQPAQAALTGALAVNQFANPIQFLCGAVQAASRLGSEQASKLCVQYLAPIIKNRQYNFPPLGVNPFVGAAARPNEVTFSEDWMRPDYIPPPGTPPTEPYRTVPPPPFGPLPAPNSIYTKFGEPADPAHGDPPFNQARPENPVPTDPVTGLPIPSGLAPPAVPTDPAAGLPGMMTPLESGR